MDYSFDALYFASDEIKNNKKFLMKAIDKEYRSLEFASDDLKNSKEIILHAIY